MLINFNKFFFLVSRPIDLLRLRRSRTSKVNNLRVYVIIIASNNIRLKFDYLYLLNYNILINVRYNKCIIASLS